ncbi:hypothetical protein NG895_03255 [Aeoliella sp. ICT_H6.2]|uniref:Tetratricopeptide repeat protein n=1 Tax=Aeoliella straminimaris TaxID=2954799 RepID=A0A9X2F632_9BACT|nr:hypothetical protein [Aeoliella straminimaris]MCO6042917.1 hypothetical protein [Aeoliella straminimaris]
MQLPSLPRLLAITLVVVAGQQIANEALAAGDYGPFHWEITTTSAEAQRRFDEGMTWMHAFDHDEAIRSFEAAAKLDEDCAMAWWGVSIASGPQYNHPVMTEERTKRAWNAMQEAQKRIDHTTPVERALIEALRHRNAETEPDTEGRAKLNQAYADAMGELWNIHYNDPNIGALYAEARMVLKPWQLYVNGDRTPVEGTEEIVSTLERVLALAPNHPGALHLYIHAVEPSQQPARALFAADRLGGLVPISGHLNHMPSHIYVLTGQWEDAITRNEVAMAADDRYQESNDVPEVQNGYIIHNTHMLVFAASMCGREKEAMAAARHMWKDFDDLVDEEPDEIDPELAYLDRLMCCVYDVQKRFGRWQQLIDEEQVPPDGLVVTRAIWHANRAIAYAVLKDFDNAEEEYQASLAAMDEVPSDYPEIDRVNSLLNVTRHFAAGEIELQKSLAEEAKKNPAAAQEHLDLAIESLEKAVEFEDAARYGEPPEPTQPVRHTLGVAYLKAGRFIDAERVYREDLAEWPNNGWSLKGLSVALKAQNKTAQAHEADEQYQAVWGNPDHPIMSSCLCVEECCSHLMKP